VTLSPVKVEAYKKLDEAVDALTTAFRSEDGDNEGILTGYLLLVGEVAFLEPGDPEDDEQDMRTIMGVYRKRGQNPLLDLGLIHEWIRHNNDDRNGD
jgi:hypothetical protein